MIYIAMNALPILAGTLGGLLFGIAWHAAFGAAPGGDGVPRRGAGLIVTAFIAEAWLAAILAGALILAPAKAGDWTMALGSAVVIWLGFVVPTLVVTLRYRGLPGRVAALDDAHWLGVMLVQAAVMKSIGLVAPPV